MILTSMVRAHTLTPEPDLLSLKIEDLKQWQALAWRRIADPQITPLERRKTLDHIKEGDSALRHCGTRMYERIRRYDQELQVGWGEPNGAARVSLSTWRSEGAAEK